MGTSCLNIETVSIRIMINIYTKSKWLVIDVHYFWFVSDREKIREKTDLQVKTGVNVLTQDINISIEEKTLMR